MKRLCGQSPEETCQTSRPCIKPKSDYKTLYNDWPYGFTQDITHLVIWLKIQGVDTPESRALIKKFVEKTSFVQRMKDGGAGADTVLYFKNIPKLQSVGALEHLHVLLRGAKQELLDEWAEGDYPM